MFIRLTAMVVTSMVALTSFAVANKDVKETEGKVVVPNCVKDSSCVAPTPEATAKPRHNTHFESSSIVR